MSKLSALKFSNRFRPYQREAIGVVRKYCAAFARKETAGAALVCHPTGAGKTAVIAGLAQCASEIGSIIVLTTREAIRDQLAREIAGNLFIAKEKFGLGEKIELPKAVYVLSRGADASANAASAYAGTLRLLQPRVHAFAKAQFQRLTDGNDPPFLKEAAQGRAIIIMTVQMLHRIMTLDAALYKALAKRLSLVVFDEGHYEPAANWSKAVRGLNAPVALLSATPFRNDLKPFQIEERNIHIYKYEAAWKAGHVRQVEVIKRKSAENAAGFCADVVAFCEGKFGSDRTIWPRILIHCDQRTRIVELGQEFVDRAFSVVAIHERFDAKGGVAWQHKDVPPPRETEGQVWIHQYKLMEGIDDHRFRVLAFFDPMKSVRSVVQQIGRVIRRGENEGEATALVLDHYRGRILQYWELYESYDRSLSPAFLVKTLSRFYLDAFTQVHPEVDYVNAKFRKRLVLGELTGGMDEILFERRVMFKEVDPNAKLEDFIALVEADFTIGDVHFKQCYRALNAAIYVYASVESPAFLHTTYFVEARHGARLLLLKPDKNLLAIADTGAGHGAQDSFGALDPLAPQMLECVLAPGLWGRVSALSSQNTSLGNRVVRRRTISAPSIAATPPILDEHGHVLSTITGYNGDRARVVDELDYLEQDAPTPKAKPKGKGAKKAAGATAEEPSLIRRYVGLANGRVSEVGSPLRFRSFELWVASLVEQMEKGERATDVLRRYAKVSDADLQDGAARNLLLDIIDVQDLYKHRKTNEPLASDELCVDRTGHAKVHSDRIEARFDITLNNEVFPVDVIYFRNSRRYRIASRQLDDAYVANDDPRHMPLVRALNERQAFNIVPEDLSVIYVHGRFYAPHLKVGAAFDKESFFAGHCLHPSQVLRGIGSEKGACVLLPNGKQGKAAGGAYDPASLFGLIEAWGSGFDSAALNHVPGWAYEPEPVSFNPSLIVCDDMGKETADFILADEKERRVVVVHAKASSTWKPYSASALQEVCAQAQKNTTLFSMFSLQEPGNLSGWDAAHSFKGTGNVQLSVSRRVRKPTNITGHAAWARLTPLLRNPLTTKEVWLVLGNMLSAQEFADNLKTDAPAPETLQLNHLLQTTIAAVGSVGAKTRIFCSP